MCQNNDQLVSFNQLNVDEQHIYNALQSVIDPEIGESIIDLGLVYDIQMHDNIARITFTMTSYACPMSEVVIAEIHEAVTKAIHHNTSLELNLVWEPEWNPSMICEHTKQKLGWNE